jgi:hypothetical protein
VAATKAQATRLTRAPQEDAGVPRPSGGEWALLAAALATAGAAPHRDDAGALLALLTAHETPSLKGGTRPVAIRRVAFAAWARTARSAECVPFVVLRVCWRAPLTCRRVPRHCAATRLPPGDRALAPASVEDAMPWLRGALTPSDARACVRK